MTPALGGAACPLGRATFELLTFDSPLRPGPFSSVSQPGQNRLRVDGRFLACGEKRVFLKGATFGPFPLGRELSPTTEFPRLAECGFNAVRVYTGADQELLDCAGEHGLTVLAGLPWEWGRDFLHDPKLRTEGELRLLEFVHRHGDHPALGALLVANEIPSDLARWMGPVDVRDSIEELIDACRAESDGLLVAYANYPSTEYLEPRNADFTAFNVYLEDRGALRRYLPRLQNLAGDRPVLITEFGLDTVRHSEDEQATLLSAHIEECLQAGVAGTTLFAWSDRWLSGGRDVDDWAFGLTRADGSEKPVLAELRRTLPRVQTHRDGVTLEDAPRISVVVCTYNGAAILSDCLSACLALDYPAFEVILVDDGSTDDTADVVSRFPTVKYVHQAHAGLSVARNCGANLATGEMIAFTDDDCEPDRDWLFWIARAFPDPKVGAVGGPNIPPGPEGVQEAVVAAAPGAPSHVLLEDLRAEHLPGCNLVIRREAFESVDGFQAQFKTAGDDVDICWRLLDKDWELAFVPSAFVWHRRRPSFLRYLKQQSGYGRAEALLYKVHPGRFNKSGIAWEGSVYAGGPVTADLHSVIYFGTMGLAGYQGLQHHAMPRRTLHEDHDGFSSRALLTLSRIAQPCARALSRWFHGGPAPSLRRAKPDPKIYQDDLREAVECSFLGDFGKGRRQLLAILRADRWQPCDETAPWDLENSPYRLLTTDEEHGPDFTLVKVRLLHPPGLRREGLQAIQRAALEAGLEPI